jgi:RNA-directed DNA polymerase
MHRNENDVSTQLQRIEALASKDTTVKFTSLANLLTPAFLAECFKNLNKRAAAGPDGVSMSGFKENLEHSVVQIHDELRKNQYRASSVRRAYIPKANKKLRPLGIPTVKDRLVQRAVGEIISKIYEPYFADFSHGFRPKRSAHSALEMLRKAINRRKTHYVVEADIKSYFDTVNHEWMMKFLSHRIADTVILRLVRKWLKAGYMERGIKVRTDEGTPQGGPISPLLANIYLHYVLDLWFEKKFQKTCKGESTLIRYADDFVVCFQHKDEAERFLVELNSRFELFNLEVAPEKTRLIEFGRTSSLNGRRGSKGEQRTFDFLGFTHYMRRRKDRFRAAVKPSRKSCNQYLQKVKKWTAENRERSVWFQSYALKKKLIGYYNYFGLRYCGPALRNVKFHVMRIWLMSLRRRSQRHTLWWDTFLAKPWVRYLPSP